ncbi:hypothetical protein C2845_PM10G14130 [Panicum miliaceum]|uniref:Uncharacterized protein n=1 Tax=Panicum miliaceum TaxID=4540 RepID=A0A3L6PE46_PANMI|nr:hypothetical protein C2845_PM10G14130 [Panicum miliaceum]
MLLHILSLRAGDGTGGRPVRWHGASAPRSGVSVPGLVESSRCTLAHGLPHCATPAMRVPPCVEEAEPEAATLAPGWQRQGNGQSNAGVSSSSLAGCQKRRRWARASSSSPAGI